MPITPEDLTRHEVLHVASEIISTLANSGLAYEPSHVNGPEIRDLAEQALDLAAPVDDWEDAAIEAGARKIPSGDGTNHARWIHPDEPNRSFETAQDLCEAHDIEPHYREVYEHWIVTTWLAEKLEQHGERVDHDFAGLTIWARTTTGQAISLDGVIEAIARELGE